MANLLRALGSSALIATLAVGASADTIYMKNGSVIRGTVVGFSDGVFTVLLGDGSGGAESRASLAGDEIERIEFEGGTDGASASLPPVDTTPEPRPASTSTVTPRPASTDQGRPPSQGGGAPDLGQSAGQSTVTIDPRADWTNSQFHVERGSRIRILASGSIKLDPTGRRTAGPGGVDVPDRDKLIPGRPTGSLIAVIGDDNDDFIYVGSQAEFVAERSGYLFLSVNEGYLRDNAGSFTANISVVPPGGGGSMARSGGMHGGTVGPPPVPARRDKTGEPEPLPSSEPADEPPASAPPVTTSRPTPRPEPARTGLPPGTATTVAREGDVAVEAALDWTNTKIRVQRGNLIRINASGTAQLNKTGMRSGPGGIEAPDNDKLIPTRPTGGLIAVVGDDNDDFVYVGQASEFVAQHDGILFLSVNEGNLRDNSGSYAAHVTVLQPQVVAPAAQQGGGQPPASAPASGESESLPRPVVGDSASGGGAAPQAPRSLPGIGEKGGTGEMVVQAKSDWTSTAIVVKRGSKVRITATGNAKLDAAGKASTPAGIQMPDPHKLIKDKPTGALVAVIGDDNSDYIFVGSAVEFTAQRDGLLFLGINEGELYDNSGFYTVRITVTPARR